VIKKYKPCIVCKKEILDIDSKFMIALEVPYLNLYVHRSCWMEIRNNLDEFMSDNLERYLTENP